MRVKCCSALYVGEEEGQKNEELDVYPVYFCKYDLKCVFRVEVCCCLEGTGKVRTRLWKDGLVGGSSEANPWVCGTAGGNYSRLLLWALPHVRLIGDELRSGFPTSSPGWTSDGEKQRGSDAAHNGRLQINCGNLIEAKNKTFRWFIKRNHSPLPNQNTGEPLWVQRGFIFTLWMLLCYSVDKMNKS